MQKILTITSGILCCLFIIALPISYCFSLWKSDDKNGKLTSNESTIQITPHFKMELSHGGLIFFSSEVPYLSGTRHLTDEKGVLYKGGHARAFRKTFLYVFFQETLVGEKNELVEVYRSADLPGVYYRYFNVTESPKTDWTLMIELWLPIIVFGILPLSFVFAKIRQRKKTI